MQAATSTDECGDQVPPEVVRTAQSWSSASSLSVCHLGYFGEVLLLFTSIVRVLVPQARPDAIALRRLSYLVSSALGSCGALRLMRSVEPHQVLPHQLRALHSRRRLLAKRNPVCPSTQSQRWLVGEVLELAASHEPQLVIVVAVADAIDATAVASSVDQFSWFSMGEIVGSRGAHGTPPVCIIGVASSLFQKPLASRWAHCCAERGTRGVLQVSLPQT